MQLQGGRVCAHHPTHHGTALRATICTHKCLVVDMRLATKGRINALPITAGPPLIARELPLELGFALLVLLFCATAVPVTPLLSLGLGFALLVLPFCATAVPVTPLLVALMQYCAFLPPLVIHW
jgi:hypothetical protein